MTSLARCAQCFCRQLAIAARTESGAFSAHQGFHGSHTAMASTGGPLFAHTYQRGIASGAELRTDAADNSDPASPATDGEPSAAQEDASTERRLHAIDPDDPLKLDGSDGFQYIEVQKPGFGDYSKRLTRAQKQERKWALRGVDRKQYRHSIPIPPDVEVTAAGTRLFFSGPLGSNGLDLEKIDNKGLAAFRLVREENNRISEVQIAGVSKSITQAAKSHIENRVNGVVRGYLLYMQLVGVGYRVSKDAKDVTYTVHGNRQASP